MKNPKFLNSFSIFAKISGNLPNNFISFYLPWLNYLVDFKSLRNSGLEEFFDDQGYKISLINKDALKFKVQPRTYVRQQ